MNNHKVNFSHQFYKTNGKSCDRILWEVTIYELLLKSNNELLLWEANLPSRPWYTSSQYNPPKREICELFLHFWKSQHNHEEEATSRFWLRDCQTRLVDCSGNCTQRNEWSTKIASPFKALMQLKWQERYIGTDAWSIYPFLYIWKWRKHVGLLWAPDKNMGSCFDLHRRKKKANIPAPRQHLLHTLLAEK
jgi:hypothetical protein